MAVKPTNNISLLAMPSAFKIITENNLDVFNIEGTGKGGRVTKGDVLLYLNLIKTNSNIKTNSSIIEKNISKRKDTIMDVLVPILGESVVEATVSKWIKKQGEFVEMDEPIVELETDKVTLEVSAAISGTLDSLVVSEGDTVEVGALLATIIAGEKSEKLSKIVVETSEVKKTNQTPKVENTSKQEVKSDPVSSSNRDNKNLEERVPMSRLRQVIARRLKEAQNTAAMLTTYNEVDMTALMEMRSSYQDSF